MLDEGVLAGDTPQPLSDVEVDFDPPDGSPRVRSRTAADGHVILEADFAKGGGAITVVSPDHVIVSALEASPTTARARPNTAGKPPEDLVFVLPRLDKAIESGTIELRGAIGGKKNESTVDVSVSAVRRLGSSTTNEAGYKLRAPRGRPFLLLAHEITSTNASGARVDDVGKTFRLDLPAHEADSVLDLDITNTPPLPLRATRIRATLPPGGPFGGDASCSATVHAAESTLLTGVLRQGRNDGSECQLEMTVADTDISPDTLLTTASLVAPDGSRSVRTEIGVLGEGASLDGFVPPPTIADESRSVRDPITLENVPVGADLRVDVFAGGQLLWVLSSPPGGLSAPILRMPASPVSFSADVVLLALSISAELDRVVLPSGTVVHRRIATSRDVIVRR